MTFPNRRIRLFSMHSTESTTYYICHWCSHAILVKDEANSGLTCDRCGHKNHSVKPKSAFLTFIYALTALILIIPANIFPFMTIELYGSRSSSTIWSGCVALVEGGSWPIGLLVFVASILIPVLKLVILFYLSLTAKDNRSSLFKTKLYQIVESIGRWSMLDIFLLAVLVAIVKLGHWATVEPEIGSYLYAAVVIFTMLASASFDPQLLWNTETEKK